MQMSIAYNYPNAKKLPLANKLLLFVVFANSVFATLLFDEERSAMVLVNYIVALVPLIYAWYKNGIYRNKLNMLVVLFLAYVAVLVLFSSNRFLSFNYFVKLFLGMIMFPLLYSIDVNERNLKGLCFVGLIILLYGNGYFIYSNLTGFGHTMYDVIVNRGYAHLSTYYTYVLCILTIPLVLIIYRDKKWVKMMGYLLVLLTAVSFILIFRRSNVLLLVFGALVYALLNSKTSKTIASFVFVGICVVAVGSILFEDVIEENFYSRESRFHAQYSLTDEGRFQENIYVYNTLKESAATILFGSGEPFNSRGKYGWWGDRQIHNAYANLVWSSGIFGLTWYCFIVALIFRNFWRIRTARHNNPLDFTICNVGIAIWAVGVLSWFMGGFPSVTYGSYYWGSLGLLLNYINRASRHPGVSQISVYT